VIYAFLIVLAVGGLTSGILAALWQGAKGALIKERSDHAATKADLAAATAAVKVSESGRASDNAREEALITALKKEVDSLEAKLPADPAAVRDRLNQLLGGVVQPAPPVPSPAPRVSAFGTMPFGGTPKP